MTQNDKSQDGQTVGSNVGLGCCELHTEKEKQEYNTCPICLWHIHKNSCAERDYLKTQSSENCLEWQDWERWAEEVCKDFGLKYDPHKYGLRYAITLWMSEQRRSHPDSVRLDTLEKNEMDVFRFVMDDQNGEPTRVMWQCSGAGLETARPTIREAIDAAAQPNTVLGHAPAKPKS